MLLKPSSIVEYFIWIINKYQSFHQQLNPPDIFRNVEISNNKSIGHTLIIQIIGKVTTFKCSPIEILNNGKLLEGFSKRDMHTIVSLVAQNMSKPKYKILIQEFCDGINKMIFKLKKIGSTEPIIKSASEISLDQEILNHLDARDAHLIGYTTASEQALSDQEQLEFLMSKKNESGS